MGKVGFGVLFSMILFIATICIYQHLSWKEHGEVMKEIEDPSFFYIIDYKYYSFEKRCWIYHVSTPASFPVKYYDYNKKDKTLTKCDKKGENH